MQQNLTIVSRYLFLRVFNFSISCLSSSISESLDLDSFSKRIIFPETEISRDFCFKRSSAFCYFSPSKLALVSSSILFAIVRFSLTTINCFSASTTLFDSDSRFSHLYCFWSNYVLSFVSFSWSSLFSLTVVWKPGLSFSIFSVLSFSSFKCPMEVFPRVDLSSFIYF